MKYITFLVPCYNGEKYLKKAIESLLPGGEDVEIIIVNDGSKDNSLTIMKEYEKKYPHIIKVVDKENGGHGSGINKGIELGTGLYFKVMDCDDWANEEGYKKLIETVKANVENNVLPDIYFTKFYYDRFDENYRYALPLEKRYPSNEMFTWNKVRTKTDDITMLHSFTFKLSLLRQNKIVLTEKCFYEDNEIVYKSLYHANSMYFIPTVFYHYYIGRNDQSVSSIAMQKHHEDYLRVLKTVFTYKSCKDIKKLGKYHANAVFKDLLSIFMLTYYASFSHSAQDKKDNYRSLLKELKKIDKDLYVKMTYHSLYFVLRLLFPPFRQPMLTLMDKILMRKMKWD